MMPYAPKKKSAAKKAMKQAGKKPGFVPFGKAKAKPAPKKGKK